MTLRDDVISNLRSNGLTLFPLRDKRPAVQGWQKYRGDIADGQPFGVVLGGQSNVFVIDVDDITLLHDFTGLLNRSYCVKTGKGFHIYVKANTLPDIMRLDNAKNQHVDIQSTGAYVIGETSAYYKEDQDGKYRKTEKFYELLSANRQINHIDFETEVKPILEKLGFDLKKKPIGKTITDAVKNGIPSGSRNETLFEYARNLIHNFQFNDEKVLSELRRFNQEYCIPPLPDWEIQKIATSAKGYRTSSAERRQNKPDRKLFINNEFDLVASEIMENNSFVTLRESKEIYFYDSTEGIYKPFGDILIEQKCQELIESCKKNAVMETIDTIRRQTYIPKKDLLDSRIINVKNGILDPTTFEIKPHSPEYLCATRLPIVINREARNLKLWNHILTIIATKDINKILEIIWMVVSGNNPFKKMFIFKGLTDTQKTTLVNIIVMIIGEHNVAKQPIDNYLSKNNRFGTSKFINKRMNIATEIGNITKDQLENQKALVGGELQNTERKNDNNEYVFDPSRFVFLFTTNELGEIFASVNDDSIVRRIEFLLFRNKIDSSKTDGDWLANFFVDENDRDTAISTIMNIVMNYKKAQSLGKIPKTKWSTIEETKRILQNELPIEDKYFRDNRLIRKTNSKLTLDEIHVDFQRFVGSNISRQEMGYILKKNGFKSNKSNGQTIYRDWAFNIPIDHTLVE